LKKLFVERRISMLIFKNLFKSSQGNISIYLQNNILLGFIIIFIITKPLLRGKIQLSQLLNLEEFANNVEIGKIDRKWYSV
jgi:hypothetical protein